MLNFFHLARNTFRESLREPVYFLVLAFSALIIGLYPYGASMGYVFREQEKLVVDSSMATTMVFGLVLAVLCASHTIAREMRNGTVLLLMSKPVHRWSFIIAKILGITAALTLFVIVCNTCTLISLRVAKDQFRIDYTIMLSYLGVLLVSGIYGGIQNFMNQKSFSANAAVALLILMPVLAAVAHFLPGDGGKHLGLQFHIIPALALLLFAVWTMGTITVVLSTRLNMVPNLVVCSIIFLMGLMSNYFLAGGSSNPVLNIFCKLLYAALPNWQFFWMADAIASKQDIPFSYVMWAAVYVVLYNLFCSIWAITLFHDRELAKDAVQ